MGEQGERKARHLVLVRGKTPAARPARKRDDAQVQAAIAYMQGALDKRWTVTMLARKVGLSRPAFARRFVEATGVSPLRYLTRCRMERAAELLASSQESLSRIGELVGYDSEFAFNRAFKRHFFVAPGSFRRAARTTFTPSLRAAA